MKILVCGGRDFGHVVRTKANTADEPPDVQQRLQEYIFIQNTLNLIVNEVCPENNHSANFWLPTDVTIIHGGAAGADAAAAAFANVQYCVEEVFLAEWTKYGHKAGYLRNQRMLDEGKPDIVVAFPGGKGTDMMKRLAKKAGIGVIDLGAKGSQTMTATYTATDIKIMLNEALLSGDKKAQEALTDALAEEYDQILKDQETFKQVDK